MAAEITGEALHHALKRRLACTDKSSSDKGQPRSQAGVSGLRDNHAGASGRSLRTGSVDGPVGAGVDGVHGAQADEAAAALLLHHVLGRALAGEEVALEPDRDEALPGLLGDLEQRPAVSRRGFRAIKRGMRSRRDLRSAFRA